MKRYYRTAGYASGQHVCAEDPRSLSESCQAGQIYKMGSESYQTSLGDIITILSQFMELCTKHNMYKSIKCK